LILKFDYSHPRFSVLIAGPTADRIGRKKVIQIATIAVVAIGIVTQALLQFVRMSVNAQ
jgi:MFS family permease